MVMDRNRGQQASCHTHIPESELNKEPVALSLGPSTSRAAPVQGCRTLVAIYAPSGKGNGEMLWAEGMLCFKTPKLF